MPLDPADPLLAPSGRALKGLQVPQSAASREPALGLAVCPQKLEDLGGLSSGGAQAPWEKLPQTCELG